MSWSLVNLVHKKKCPGDSLKLKTALNKSSGFVTLRKYFSCLNTFGFYDILCRHIYIYMICIYESYDSFSIGMVCL